MKILVTGGAGFIGSHLCEKLCNDNSVTVLDNLSTGAIGNISRLIENKKIEFIKGDILDRPLVERLVKEADVVYHLAAAVGVKLIMESPSESMITNILGSHNVIESCSKNKKLLVLASTSEVYGKSKKLPLKESDDRIYGPTEKVRWNYAESKAIDEMIALAYIRQDKLNAVIIRLFNVVGERQAAFYGMVLPRFVGQALRNEPLTVYGTGKQTRCFSYVGDVAECLSTLPKKQNTFGQVINLGSNEEISILGLAKKVKKIANSKSKIIFIPYKKVEEEYGSGFEDIERRLPDLSKAKKLLGFRQKIMIDEIIRRVVEEKRPTMKNNGHS